jgi:hypothetical protein
MMDEELNLLFSEVEQEIKEHPIREKLKIYTWILYCYIFNNNLKLNTMKKIKALFLKIKLFIVQLYSKADELIERIAPVAINVVEQIKTINETATGDIIELIISMAIKGNADDLAIKAIREQLRKRLPEVLEIMRLSMNIAKVDDANLQVKMILDAINMSPDAVKNAHYHAFCSLVIEKISDGNLTWGESVIIAQYYYDNIYRNNGIEK